MAKKNVVDAEAAVEELKNKKFGLSIQNIIALVTVLSTGIAGWYSFTGRIDGLEEIVTGFAEASDIEEVYQEMGKWLKGVYPCSTGLVVPALARPDWLVEIEVTAVIPD